LEWDCGSYPTFTHSDLQSGVALNALLRDRTLRAIAHARPETPNALLGISRVGAAKVKKYGSEILAVCAASSAR